jgi:hypothetical protein
MKQQKKARSWTSCIRSSKSRCSASVCHVYVATFTAASCSPLVHPSRRVIGTVGSYSNQVSKLCVLCWFCQSWLNSFYALLNWLPMTTHLDNAALQYCKQYSYCIIYLNSTSTVKLLVYSLSSFPKFPGL